MDNKQNIRKPGKRNNPDQAVPVNTLPREESPEVKTGNWFKRKYIYVIGVFKNLITQGISPKKIAAAIALGFFAGTFPIIGTHTFLGIVLAFIFRLNQIAVYLGMWLSLPVFFIVLLPSLRLGEFLLQAEPMDLEMLIENSKYLLKFNEQSLQVLEIYGKSILHLMLGWIPLILLVCLIVYIITLYTAKYFMRKRNKL